MFSRIDDGLRPRPALPTTTAVPWETLEGLMSARTSDRVAEIIGRLMTASGYDVFTFLFMPWTGQEDASWVLLDTRCETWVDAYRADGVSCTDPLVCEGARRIDPFTWSDIVDDDPQAAETPAMVLAQTFGVANALIVPVVNDEHRAGLFIAYGGSGDPSPRRRKTLAVVAHIAFQRLLALRRAAVTPGDSRLSPRETQVLYWITAGKSDWQIGKILNISSKTVNYHAENVKRKFGVATRMQAVVAALKAGAIRD
jgi:DNA-binding CsgD family transcriptional regulator